VPNVGPNVTTNNVGSTISLVNVATLDVASKWILETTSNPNKAAKNKGKMIVAESAEPEITKIADLRPTQCNKIIEAISTPIQANMDVKDTGYFDQLL
nr:hypothetical protein [Tanacetum cinerariifolium]